MSVTVWPNGLQVIPLVSSEFGPRKAPLAGASTFHLGIDTYGHTYNHSPCDGVVIFAQYNGGGGNEVRVQAANGDWFGMKHNATMLVKKGDRVSARQRVGVQGRTGNVTGIHCHFETHPGGGVAVNPRTYMAKAIPTTPAGGGGTPITPTLGEEDLLRVSDGQAIYLVGGTNITHISPVENEAFALAGVPVTTIGLARVQAIQSAMIRLNAPAALTDTPAAVWNYILIHKSGLPGAAKDWLMNISDAVGAIDTVDLNLTPEELAALSAKLGEKLLAEIAKGQTAQTAAILAAISQVDENVLTTFGLKRI